MKRVLIATDFSSHANRAMQHGVAFARLFDAEIELFTSYSVSSLALGPDDLAAKTDYLEQAQRATRERLEELTDQLRGQGESVTGTIVSGPPTTTICERVDTGDVELLVLGSRGPHGFDHTFLGSVAERTTRAALCPVLTASADVPEPTDAGIRKILVATDFSRDAEAALEWAQELAARCGASILLLHSVPPPFGVGEEEIDVEDEGTSSRIEESRAQLEQIAAGVDAECEIVVGRRYPDTDVLHAADEHGADLIVIGTRGRRGLPHVVLGSTTVRVMRRAKVPVVSVKPRA